MNILSIVEQGLRPKFCERKTPTQGQVNTDETHNAKLLGVNEPQRIAELMFCSANDALFSTNGQSRQTNMLGSFSCKTGIHPWCEPDIMLRVNFLHTNFQLQDKDIPLAFHTHCSRFKKPFPVWNFGALFFLVLHMQSHQWTLLWSAKSLPCNHLFQWMQYWPNEGAILTCRPGGCTCTICSRAEVAGDMRPGSIGPCSAYCIQTLTCLSVVLCYLHSTQLLSMIKWH